MNRVELLGGLTRDPECSVNQRGTATWLATLAVNGTRYDGEARQQVVKTTFVSLSAFGWLAEELINAGYGKGDELHVVGELDQFEIAKDDGTKDRKTRVRPLVVTPTRRSSPMPARHPAQSHTPSPDPWGPPREEPPF